MKRIKKFVVLLIICLLTMAIPVSASTSERINKKSVTLIKGQSITLKVTGTKEIITWSSSKKSIVTVSSKGKVVAKKTGTANITARYGKKKLTYKVTVETPKINKTAVTLNVGKSYQLKMSGTKQKIKWTSSKSSVATVSSNGMVAGKKDGTALITATVGGKKYTCKVSVKNAEKSTLTGYSEYDDILKKYYKGISERWDMQEYRDNGLCYLIAYEADLSKIGYYLLDIDNNGIRELLIGYSGKEEWYEGMIYDLYTIVNKKAVLVTTSGERDRYYLCKDYTIANEGSSSALTSSYSYYNLKLDQLLLKESVFFDAYYSRTNPWYYTKRDSCKDYSSPISESTANRIRNSYVYMPIPYKALSKLA